jgi:UDP-glucose 4-epimerase
MVVILKEIFNKEGHKAIYTDPRPGDVKHSQAGISKIYKMLKFQTKTDFKDGLTKTVEWYKRDHNRGEAR